VRLSWSQNNNNYFYYYYTFFNQYAYLYIISQFLTSWRPPLKILTNRPLIKCIPSETPNIKCTNVASRAVKTNHRWNNELSIEFRYDTQNTLNKLNKCIEFHIKYNYTENTNMKKNRNAFPINTHRTGHKVHRKYILIRKLLLQLTLSFSHALCDVSGLKVVTIVKQHWNSNYLYSF